MDITTQGSIEPDWRYGRTKNHGKPNNFQEARNQFSILLLNTALSKDFRWLMQITDVPTNRSAKQDHAHTIPYNTRNADQLVIKKFLNWVYSCFKIMSKKVLSLTKIILFFVARAHVPSFLPPHTPLEHLISTTCERDCPRMLAVLLWSAHRPEGISRTCFNNQLLTLCRLFQSRSRMGKCASWCPQAFHFLRRALECF